MLKLNVNQLLEPMVNATQSSLGHNWSAISGLATSSLKGLAQNLVSIEEHRKEGTISQEQAQILIDMQRNVVKTILLTEEGLGLLAAEAAINAAFDVVRTAVNTAIGWNIL